MLFCRCPSANSEIPNLDQAGAQQPEHLADDPASADLGHELTIGTITLACALGYLDLRFPDVDWRAGHPGAGDWLAGIERNESIAATRSPQALAA